MPRSKSAEESARIGISPKPALSFWQIFNMSVGFLGIQFGFALQNSNASGILRNYGAEVDNLSWFWLAAPLVGLIVQPVVGYYSDRTWTKLGRRRPYFLAGAILSSIALVLMPNAGLLGAFAPLVFVGAGFLMVMDACFNLAMEPFRALVADNLPEFQRTTGFSVQTFLIGVGAVAGSFLPYLLVHVFGVSNNAPAGTVAPNTRAAFYIGAAVFAGSVLYTVFTTKEYSPGKYEMYHGRSADQKAGPGIIFSDLRKMPRTMRQLGLVQFFSWFALFGMWVFTTDAIATHIFKLPVSDKSSVAYRSAQDWTGVIFAVYNLVAAFYALLLPTLAKRIGRKKAHTWSLLAGGIGLLSFYIAPNKEFLVLSFVLVGIAWASILSMPYVILASSIPPGKMGVYMGLFNFFITLPQILNGIIGGPLLKIAYNNQPVYMLVTAGASMLCAAAASSSVHDPGVYKMKIEQMTR